MKIETIEKVLDLLKETEEDNNTDIEIHRISNSQANISITLDNLNFNIGSFYFYDDTK